METGRKGVWSPAALSLWVVMTLAAVGLVAGCGRKAPPEPPLGTRPPKVQDLSFSITRKTIRLSWTVPRSTGKEALPVSGFLIYRSMQNAIEEECPNCPLRFVEVGDLPVPAVGGSPGPVIFTQPIEPGYRYVYKVVTYAGEGRTGRDSNLIEFEY